MNRAKTMITKLTDTKAIIQDMADTCKRIDPEYPSEEAKYIQALTQLKASQTDFPVTTYLDAQEAALASALLFMAWQGFRLNLEGFYPNANTLSPMEDFEVISEEYKLWAIPAFQTAQKTINGLQDAISILSEEQKACMDVILDHYAYLKTTGYKLSHYRGFQFANDFLPQVIPGYVRDLAYTNRYTLALREYLKVDLNQI